MLDNLPINTGLENRRGGNSTVGSNPTPSARFQILTLIFGLWITKARSSNNPAQNGPTRHKYRHTDFPFCSLLHGGRK